MPRFCGSALKTTQHVRPNARRDVRRRSEPRRLLGRRRRRSRYVMGGSRAAGLQPRVDQAGNIFGRRAGSDSSVPPILFGLARRFRSECAATSTATSIVGRVRCHRGTDGRNSSHAALARDGRVGGRRRCGIQPGIDGSRMPSPATWNPPIWTRSGGSDPCRRHSEIGGDPGRITEAIRPRGAHHCYLELHIEQGGSLERQAIPSARRRRHASRSIAVR